MRHPAHLQALELAASPLLLAACRIRAGSAPTMPALIEGAAEPSTDARVTAALCDALRAAGPDRSLRLHVLATGPASLSARLDVTDPQGDRPGLRLDFSVSVSDHDMTAIDYRNFACDLLRHGQPD
ncbi:hypothetical protein [Paracoccus hibiscisoli]|uniref:Uncharacterized protein n=1 Tax=Paracoccus hibiscisoli TaxID=2023261 RepID=A0A4U0QX92_9RHOB|nr:hypothetical protein [Paracoccus hibiscisoli]TJZ86182.1 hypothetical protein FA740_04660 [Paracoccus hibiscisoli]